MSWWKQLWHTPTYIYCYDEQHINALICVLTLCTFAVDLLTVHRTRATILTWVGDFTKVRSIRTVTPFITFRTTASIRTTMISITLPSRFNWYIVKFASMWLLNSCAYIAPTLYSTCLKRGWRQLPWISRFFARNCGSNLSRNAYHRV